MKRSPIEYTTINPAYEESREMFKIVFAIFLIFIVIFI